MSKLTCTRNNCNGTIDDGYCDTCGMAALNFDRVKSYNRSLAATAVRSEKNPLRVPNDTT